MANGNRWSMSYGRRFTAFALMAVGLFIACFGVGLGSAPVLVLGLAVGVLGPAVLVLTAVRATTRQYIFGTAHVYSASPPPSAGMVGRCELHLAVFAEGIDGVAVRVLDPAVPVSKWPDDGATLPIEVVANNPRKVRVLWDQMVTHAQAAGEDLYPQYVEGLPDDLEDDFDDLPPADFFDDDDLGPLPPSPPARMPSGPMATIDGAGMDFAPVPAPMLVPPGTTASRGGGRTAVATAPPVAVEAGPTVDRRARRVEPDRDADLDAALDRDLDLDRDRDLDRDADLDARLDADLDAGRRSGVDGDVMVSHSAPAAPADSTDSAPVSLPLPRRQPRPHLRRPSPRPRRSVEGGRGNEQRASGNRTGAINPVYVEDTPAEPPPEWPFTPADTDAPAPVRPESRPEPDDTEVVSGTVEAAPGGAYSGTIVDDHAYSDRSETDRMTFDRSSFRAADIGPMEITYDAPTDRSGPDEAAGGPGAGGAVANGADDDEQPFNVVPLRVGRPAGTVEPEHPDGAGRGPGPVEPVPAEPTPTGRPAAGPAAEPAVTAAEPAVTAAEPVDEEHADTRAAAPAAARPAPPPVLIAVPAWAGPVDPDAEDGDSADDDRDSDAPPTDADGLATEPASYLTAPSAGLSQLGTGGFSVTLFVRELGRSVAFYRDMLGLVEVDTGRNSAVLARGESRILLKRVSDLQPVDRRIVHLNLEVPDVQAAYEELRSKSVEFVHRPRVVSQGEQLELWAATFRDPDGHAIALTRWELRR